MKVALVGLGAMGIKHSNVLRSITSIDEIYIVDSERCGENGVIYCNVEQLLNSVKGINFAIISTPTSTHQEIAEQFIQNKIPVLIEKPVTKTLDESDRLIEMSKKYDCKVAVGHIERYNPAILAFLKELQEDEKIIHCFCKRVSPYPNRIQDVGVSLDLAIHDIDLLRYITKKQVTGYESSKSLTVSSNDDSASFFLNFDQGASASVLTSWLYPYRERKIEILTNKNLYEIDLMLQKVVKYTNNDSNSYHIHPLFVEKENALKNQTLDFIDYVNKGNIGKLASLEDAVSALKIVIGENR